MDGRPQCLSNEVFVNARLVLRRPFGMDRAVMGNGGTAHVSSSEVFMHTPTVLLRSSGMPGGYIPLMSTDGGCSRQSVFR